MNKNIPILKDSLRLTLEERNDIKMDELFYPSKIWREAIEPFNFLQYLPEKELKNIRMHTMPISGSTILDVAYHPKRESTDEDKLNTFWEASQYKNLTENLPEKYCLTEPVPNKFTEKLSLPFKKKLITNDLIRYQKFITNLYNLGIFKNLENKSKKILIEIGSGYGGLLYHIRKILGDNTACILVDLPEMIFWSGIYITINNPDAKIFIYNPKIHKKKLTIEEIGSYDFLLIPNYKLVELVGDINFDFAFNQFSFQEMTENQINFYCDYISKNLKGFFVSDNMDIHPSNKEIKVSIIHFLRKYFKIIPTKTDIELLKKEFTPELWQVYFYFGIPLNLNLNFEIVKPEVLGANYKFNFEKNINLDGKNILIKEKKQNLNNLT
tara:strand:- start:37354 stop:38499 length:1146 start_codon:yes stop_codon:yes gene_type:complete